jgi:predicted dehydrogenase
LVEKCCHHFDLMRLITQSEPTRIYASGAMDVNHKDERYNGETPDIIDNALVIVDFQNGVRASLELCMFADGADPQEQLTAIGDKAKIEACIPGPARFWEGAQSEASLLLQPRAKDKVIRETIEVDADLAAAGDHHGSTYYQHEKFANALLNGGPIEVSALDGAVAVRMGAAAQESLKSGEAVQL